MALWLILGAMTVLAVGLVLAPLLRGWAARPTMRREHDLAVYRAQLGELERDRALGLLDDGAAAAARLEIQRRILALGSGGSTVLPGRVVARPLVATVLMVAVPVLAGLLYGALGSPGQPAAPFAAREAEQRSAAGEAALPSVETMIARLEERVRTDPEDLEGWVRLGQARMLTERFDDAVAAFRRAIALDDGIAGLHAALGEALVMADGGVVGETARAAFERALALQPGEPRAMFYRGLAALQRGERGAALDLWLELVREAPPDAPFLPELRRRAAALAVELGRDPEDLLPAAPTGAVVGEAPDVPTSRLELEALAARLAAAPKDWQGWIALARGWVALDEPGQARAALAEAADAYAGAPFVQQQLRIAAAELGLDEGGAGAPRQGPSAEQMRAAQGMAPDQRDAMIRAMVDGLAARLEAQPEDAEGWRMLGRSWRVLGEVDRSVEAFARLAALRPDDLDAQLDYADALVAQGGGAALSGEAVAQLERVLELDQDNPDALLLLGQAAAAAGDGPTAASLWRRLLARLPAGSPEQAEVRRLLDGLDPGG